MKMSNFKLMSVTETLLGVSTSFGSILTKIMLLLQLQKLKTVWENWFFYWKGDVINVGGHFDFFK